MNTFAQNPVVLYILLGLIALWRLPAWGIRVLDFIRDLRKFRKGR
jgi:hypothetical protein